MGYLLEQLPFVGLAWLAASTALAAVEADLASPWAWPAVIAAAITAAALGLVIARHLRASESRHHGGGGAAHVDAQAGGPSRSR